MKKIIYVFLAVCIVLGSCSTGEAAGAAIKLFGGSSEALLFLNCRAVSEDEIEFEFNSPVTIKSIKFDPELAVASIEDGSTVKVRLGEIPKPGIEIKADILAEDLNKNTINVLIPFRSRNNRMPKLVINEICTETGGNANTGKKEEFIEFKVKSAGNLGAMRVVINGNTAATKKTVYEFLPVEVKKDEYMVLHLRTYNTESKDEHTDNLNESVGLNASATGRDFWIPGDTKLIHKTAMIYVLDQDDRVIDAVILSEKPDNWWAKDYFAETAEFLFNSGSWKSPDGGVCGPKDAVSSAGTTNTRTICRDETVENSGTAKDWYITVTSGATPGKLNNPKRYVP
jgi:predicted small secreted protein